MIEINKDDMAEQLNFNPVGIYLIIDLDKGETTKAGVYLPDKSMKEIAGDAKPEVAYKIVAASSTARQAGFSPGKYVYYGPFADINLMNINGHFYSLNRIDDFAGFAPDGFDREAYEKAKEERANLAKERHKAEIEAQKKGGLGIVTTDGKDLSLP